MLISLWIKPSKNPINSNQYLVGHSVLFSFGKSCGFYINGDKTIEVHIITEEELFLYDKSMKIKFKQFIRKEQKYDSAEDLANQLQLDRQECLSN